MGEVITAIAAQLLDTVPGRLVIADLMEPSTPRVRRAPVAEQIAARSTAQWCSAATSAIRTYLYGGEFAHVFEMNPDDAAVRSVGLAVAEQLLSPHHDTSAFAGIHHGVIDRLREPVVANRSTPAVLPDGALWTAPEFADGRDAWSRCGEHDSTRSPHRYRITHRSNQIYRVNTADDWSTLVRSHPIEHRGTVFPDWVAIARRCDAVHVSILGLLCAQPRVSTVPLVGADPTGDTHSRSGPIPGVSEWTVPSTAWLRLPPGVAVQPLPV